MPPPPSKNFDFLRPTFNAVADEAAYAESYVLTDPSTAVWKLRVAAERMVATIYLMRRLPRPFRADLHDCLQETAFLQSVPRVVVDKPSTSRPIRCCSGCASARR